jgi:hypothetical protein
MPVGKKAISRVTHAVKSSSVAHTAVDRFARPRHRIRHDAAGGGPLGEK